MGKNSNIEWTDHTFNPWVGCVKVSEGCKFCYAETFMTRKDRWANTWGPAETTERIKTKTWAQPLKWNKEAKAAGKRVKVFCASLADVFEDNPQLVDWRRELLNLIIETPHLDWQLLTKRPENVCWMIEQATGFSDAEMWLPPNCWIGTSVENQQQADERIPELLKIPAKVRFLSIEPLLGPIDLTEFLWYTPERNKRYSKQLHQINKIDWVIVGGESGANARPMNPDWVRSLCDQCVAADIPYFFKQHGEWLHVDYAIELGLIDTYTDTHKIKNFDGVYYANVGKKAAGNLLDGRKWEQLP